MSAQIRSTYKKELKQAIENDWLIQLMSKLGHPKELIPLMAMLQQNKLKVCPVMDIHS